MSTSDFALKAMESHWKGLEPEKVHLSCVGKDSSGCGLSDSGLRWCSWTWAVAVELERGRMERDLDGQSGRACCSSLAPNVRERRKQR